MSNKKRIYTVATAHLDTVWSWDLEETIDKYIYDTLVDNFKYFEKYPHYNFSFEGSYRYELMKEYYPDLFAKMKDYVAKGRWNVCGSAYENGDVNIPSPEALFRNILIGNSYFRNEFGKTSCDIYLPDCFGFGWALPSIMHHANLKGFTTQKLSWGSAYGTPFDIGRWRGPDGKESFASIKMLSYNGSFKEIRNYEDIQNKLKENEKFGFDWTAAFHGIGDRGGAVREPSIQVLEKEVAENGKSDIEIRYGAADDIYRDMANELTPEQIEKLPLWDNELVMTNHAVGGYTSRALGKRWNRRAEELADMAERGSVIGDWFGTYNYNRENLTRAWKRVIAHHFHDDMPGTSCQRVYKRSWNDLYVSMNQFESELGASVSSFTNLLKTDSCKGTAVTVFNPVEAQRNGAVTVVLDKISSSYARVFDGETEIKSQTRNLKNGKTEVTFIANVKSLGAKVYDIRESATPCEVKSDISISGNTLENAKYKVTLNKNGDIASIIDKTQNGAELLKEPVVIGLYNYNGSRPWPAWEMNYAEMNKKPDRIPSLVNLEVYENGAARVAFKVTQKDDRSMFTNIIALTDGGETVEVYSEYDWRSLRTLAKNTFSFNASNENATFDLGLGAIVRSNATEKLFEVPAQKWADITDKDGTHGVSVLSECKYGWDKFDNNTLRLTAVHTPKFNYRIDSMQSMLDLGLNRYSFAIYSHEGKVGADTQLQARFFTQPMCAFVCDSHDGVLGAEYSFGGVSDNGVIIRAMKKAEETDEIIVRLGEGANKSVENFTLTLGNGIESAREVYASEEFIKDATVTDGKLVTSFAPYEIKSFALTLKKCDLNTEKAVSTPLDLEYDKNIVTKQGENGEFKYTLPYEITPDKFSFGGVEFDINKDGKNAVIANGQTIKVSDKAEKVVLICTSLNGDKKPPFKVGSKSVTKLVPSAFERPARWDMYDFGETARIKDCKVALELTHCHKDKKDVIAKSTYFFAIELQLDGANEITLPKSEDIVIIGAVEVTGVHALLATPLCETVEERPFTFKMNLKEKIRYVNGRRKSNMGDKKYHNRKNWGKDY